MRAFAGILRKCGGICRQLGFGVSAAALGLAISPPTAIALDLDGADGLNTETIANRERLRVWDNAKKYGAEKVDERDRRELKPDGVRAGNYLIYPSAKASTTFDDNILAHDIEKVPDIRFELTPQVKLQSQFSRHVLDFSLDGKIVNYLEHTDQDYASARAKVEAALHFDHANTLSASAFSALEYEERDDPSYPLTAKGPVGVFHNRASAGVTHDAGRLYGTVSASVESWNYENVEAVNGTTLNEAARDTVVGSSQLKWGYRFSPGFELVGKIRGLRSENRGDSYLDRSAWGVEALAGLAFETDPLLRWRVLGGYGMRDYDQLGIARLNTSLIEGQMEWLPTQRLTIYGDVGRQILESNDTAATGIVQTSAAVRGEFELYHDLVLSAGMKIREDVYSGVNRTDMFYSGHLGADYYLSKNWLFTFAYEHQVRDSNFDSLDMNRNRFTIGAKLRF